jgi:hypothetical protein
MTEAPSVPCEICAAGEFADYEWCDGSEHTPAAQRLARALANSLAGPPGNPEEHPEWYIEDAAAIVDDIPEGDGFVVEHDPGCLGEYFKVNGVEFWLDLNAEGFTTPELAARHRAELAEEEAEDD